MWTCFPFFLFLLNKFKLTKLSCCHAPSFVSPHACLFSSMCVSEIHTDFLAQRRKSVTMETRRRESKSYLLRRELRQQRESTVWVAEKRQCTQHLYFSLLFWCWVYHHQTAFLDVLPPVQLVLPLTSLSVSSCIKFEFYLLPLQLNSCCSVGDSMCVCGLGWVELSVICTTHFFNRDNPF